MFRDPDFHQIHTVLLRIMRDRQRWHDAEYTVKNSGLASAFFDTGKVQLQKDAFAWYKTLEKNVLRYMRAVMDLEELEAEHLAYIGKSSEDLLTPHKVKQLLIIKLVAEIGRAANDLRSVLKKSNDSVGSAVRLRRRIRWLEVKLDSLTREPLMSSDVVTEFYAKSENLSSEAQLNQDAPLAPSPTFIASVGSAEGESLTSDESGDENADETSGSPQITSQLSATASRSPDAVDAYWSSEHHQIDHNPLTSIFGSALPFHSLDIHRSDSYVKEKGDPNRASLPWRNIDKEYVDPNSEEKALERLSVTVQEMMGRAYTAALESVPLDVEEFRAAKREQQAAQGKTDFKRPTSILANVKGQKWMEKKFRHSVHASEVFIYHPPPIPAPAKLLLAKLSDDTYPPIPTGDYEIVRQRAKEMPPRFVNQHDLLKKTKFTLYELLFDAEKIKSKVDLRKASETVGHPTTVRNNDVSLAPSASITRGPYDLGGSRPKSPANGTVTTKAKSKNGKHAKDANASPRRLPHVDDPLKSLAVPTNQKDRVYMTRSGWYHTRRMPAPMQYITLRLERVKELMKVIKTESISDDQKISSVKQITALGVTNSEIITDLVSMISSSSQRSSSMDLRFEVLKLLLTLGFIEDAVLKELLVFISSSNHQILCDLLRCLRKALSSPRMSRPFGKTILPADSAGAPDLTGKSLNLLYVSPTDCLLVHRLVQLSQCTSSELRFYAAACLRKVKVMPPPPPLAPQIPFISEDSMISGTIISSNTEHNRLSEQENKALLEIQAAYAEKLQEYEALLKQLDQQERDIAQLTELAFRQIALSGTHVVVEALQELIAGIGATDDELFKVAYDILEKSPVSGIRAALVRLLADGFLRLMASPSPGIDFRLNEFQDILLQRLVKDADKQVCTECARTFFKLGLYEKVSESIIKDLDNKLDIETKMQAIRCAIGLRIRGSRITRALVDLLELDPSDGVRIAACRALANVGTTDRRALAALRERYERAQGVVAREAGRALAVLTAPSSNAAFNPAFLDALVDRVVKSGP